MQAHQAHSVPYLPTVWCQPGWDIIYHIIISQIILSQDQCPLWSSQYEKINIQTSVFYVILSRWRNGQAERNMQLLLGGLLLPRLRGRWLCGSSKNGKRKFCSNLLTSHLSGERRIHHLLRDRLHTSPWVFHHRLLLRRRCLCPLINCLDFKTNRWVVAGHSMRLQTTQCCCLGAGKVMAHWCLEYFRLHPMFYLWLMLEYFVFIPSFLRSSVALHAEVDALEDLGNYLRTVSLEVDPTYREKDGIVGQLSS